MSINLVELTKTLIDIPSATGEEAAVGHFLHSYLKEVGYQVEFQQVEGDRGNIIATTGAPPRVVFSTHMDTVPPHIPAAEDEHTIHGRGACDAKGIIAAQISAAQELLGQGVEEVGLLFTVDEEMSSAGAAVANQHRCARDCRYLINGEPTDNRLAVGTKGSLRLKLSSEGQSAHSAYPEQGESAIEKLLSALEAVRKCDWPSDEFFGETTCNIGTIQGGTRPNVIPAHAEAVLQIRLATDETEIKALLEKAIDGQATIEYLSVHPPIRLLDLGGFDRCVVRFTTDIPYLSNWGRPLLLGPGSILDAHTPHELVKKAELQRAVELYVKLATILINDHFG
ncbi:MAG TPA: M20/M25/M40 family metallo-hydrolase [Pyrinomonadaceae bacterium]|nr:M20/M25/M40 family metallo-hydrolase [Pyrinomonadaceae bacterium]